MISKEFLKSKKPTIVKHHVDEWNDDVCIKSMSGTDRDKIMSKRKGDQVDICISDVVKYCLCDEDGKRIIGDNETESLDNVELAVLIRLAEWGLEASGLTDKALTEVKKNS